MNPDHPNRGDFYERTQYSKEEKAFADLWEFENDLEQRRNINYRQGLLQDLFYDPDPHFGYPHIRHDITDSERFVAATVIQWLGTNCGMAFLTEALEKCGYTIVRNRKPNQP